MSSKMQFYRLIGLNVSAQTVKCIQHPPYFLHINNRSAFPSGSSAFTDLDTELPQLPAFGLAAQYELLQQRQPVSQSRHPHQTAVERRQLPLQPVVLHILQEHLRLLLGEFWLGLQLDKRNEIIQLLFVTPDIKLTYTFYHETCRTILIVEKEFQRNKMHHVFCSLS